jgi:peptidyl-prolyl cis-trans isomerase A (cyclophilin A)
VEEPAAPDALPEPPDTLHDPARAERQAPERYSVALATTRGMLTIDVRRSWAPIGADRFYNLVRLGYYDDVAFFRVLDGYVAQTGLHGHPKVNAAWARAFVPDDRREQSNVAGTVAFAASGPNTRTTQFFVNLANNTQLDKLGFAPFGRVKELDVAQKLYAGYGEGSPSGNGPAQARVKNEGNAYLRRFYPKLDYVQRAAIVAEANPPAKQRTLPPPKQP